MLEKAKDKKVLLAKRSAFDPSDRLDLRIFSGNLKEINLLPFTHWLLNNFMCLKE